MTKARVSAPKMDEVVCAHNLSKRKEAKPILQATVIDKNPIFEMMSVALSVYRKCEKEDII
jgi:hypothetical protein